MSDYEKYVEPAAHAGHDAFFATERYGGDGELVPVKRADVWNATARAVLAVVGPLIAEDTRVRMVEAAGRAVERDTAPPFYYCPTSGEIEQTYEGGFTICCEAPLHHEPISPAAVAAAKRVPS